MPVINQPLIVLPSNDLGFEHKIPEEGYPVYAGKGQFYNRVKLSNEGLVGSGMLNYLTSITEAPEYTFSWILWWQFADKFSVLKQDVAPEFPAVEGEIVDQFWLPYKDTMFVTEINNPF